jgi:hypothetical protein
MATPYREGPTFPYMLCGRGSTPTYRAYLA